MRKLENKTAVVTGASSGIGRAIAITCAAAGARVVVNYNSSGEHAAAVCNEITAAGGTACHVQADISDTGNIENLLAAATSAYGPVDIWVNNAGADILTGQGATRTHAEKLQALIKVDLAGTIHCCWVVVPHMQQQGHGNIINMSWDRAMSGLAGVNPQMFSAVKAGIAAFSRSLAKTTGPAIRVNVLAPGWIETEFARTAMDAEYHAQRCAEIPLGRFGTTEEVAEAALFLASEESSYLTGAVLNIGGGSG